MDKRQRLVEVPTCVDIYALRSEFGVRRRSAQSLAGQSPSFPLPRVPGTKDFQLAEVILTDGNSAIRFDAAVDATAVTKDARSLK